MKDFGSFTAAPTPKCEKYWPNRGKTQVYQNITVETISETQLATPGKQRYWAIRNFSYKSAPINIVELNSYWIKTVTFSLTWIWTLDQRVTLPLNCNTRPHWNLGWADSFPIKKRFFKDFHRCHHIIRNSFKLLHLWSDNELKAFCPTNSRAHLCLNGMWPICDTIRFT